MKNIAQQRIEKLGKKPPLRKKIIWKFLWVFGTGECLAVLQSQCSDKKTYYWLSVWGTAYNHSSQTWLNQCLLKDSSWQTASLFSLTIITLIILFTWININGNQVKPTLEDVTLK